MNIVLDTNVLVSGFLSDRGTPARILGLAVEGRIRLCLDSRIAHEYERVLSKPKFGLSRINIQSVLMVLYDDALWIEPPPFDISLPDPDDLMFVETAIAALSDALVTGNKRHYPQHKMRAIKVLSPAEFIELMRRKGRILD